MCCHCCLRSPQNSRGFTLIELVIVVAIIGVLVALSLANFHTALVRSKVGQAVEDQRALGLAIEQLRLDAEYMLVDIWDDDTAEGRSRIQHVFRGVGKADPNLPQQGKRSAMSVLAPLTSPVMYISHIPADPFAKQANPRLKSSRGGLDEQPDLVGNQTYLYADQDPRIPGQLGKTRDRNYELERLFPGLTEKQAKPLRPSEYVLIGLGPSRKGKEPYKLLARMGMPYDPTNGVLSAGQILYRAGATD